MASSHASALSGLKAQLKSQEEAAKNERERARQDSEAWRVQMANLEEEVPIRVVDDADSTADCLQGIIEESLVFFSFKSAATFPRRLRLLRSFVCSCGFAYLSDRPQRCPLFPEQVEASGSKARAQLTAARDESERLRRAAYDAAAETSEFKAKLEAKRCGKKGNGLDNSEGCWIVCG